MSWAQNFACVVIEKKQKDYQGILAELLSSCPEHCIIDINSKCPDTFPLTIRSLSIKKRMLSLHVLEHTLEKHASSYRMGQICRQHNLFTEPSALWDAAAYLPSSKCFPGPMMNGFVYGFLLALMALKVCDRADRPAIEAAVTKEAPLLVGAPSGAF
eukprot:320074-Pelagomonas_calceolata.AAC.2